MDDLRLRRLDHDDFALVLAARRTTCWFTSTTNFSLDSRLPAAWTSARNAWIAFMTSAFWFRMAHPISSTQGKGSRHPREHVGELHEGHDVHAEVLVLREFRDRLGLLLDPGVESREVGDVGGGRQDRREEHVGVEGDGAEDLLISPW